MLKLGTWALRMHVAPSQLKQHYFMGIKYSALSEAHITILIPASRFAAEALQPAPVRSNS
jgi:hypothetical protein